MNNLDFYLECDHSARRRVMFISVAAGVAVGAVAQLSGVSFDRAVIICVLATGLVEIIGAFRYVEPDRKHQRAVIALPVRRDLLRAAFSAAALVVLALLRIPRLEALAFERRLERVSATPTSPQSIQEAKQILVRARTAEIKIAPAAVKEVGKKFVEASKNDPSAWEAVLQFLSYRSVLNDAYLPSLPNLRRYKAGAEYDMGAVIWSHGPVEGNQLNAPPAEVWLAGEASPETCARFEGIEERKTTGSGAQFIIFDWLKTDFALGLDGRYLKNVIVRNAPIAYTGYPVILDHVYFVNCTFNVQQPHGQDLALAVLSNPATTFAKPDHASENS